MAVTFPAFLQLRHEPSPSTKGAFLAEIDGALSSAEQRFSRFSTEAQRMLDRAMTTGRTSGGSLDLGVAELQRQAVALQQKAMAARELAMATELAAREAGDHSQMARLQVAAMQATAREAEQAAAAARNYATAQEQVQTQLNRSVSAVTAVTGATTRHRIANDNAAASANATRAGMQNLGYQLNDISTMWALGSRPMQIFASQSGQVIQSLQLMSGGTSRLATFLGGPWGIALTVATIALTPLIGKLFDTSDAMDQVEFASSRLGDAQSILGQVMDTTTGKIETQSNALMGLARAQALAGQIAARQQMATARGALSDEAAFRPHVTGGFGGGFNVTRGRDATGDIASAVLDNSLNTTEAIAGLESLRRTGYATEEQFLSIAKSITDLGVAAEDLKAFEALQRMLTGQGTADDRAMLLDPARASRSRRDALSDEEKALKQATEETARYIESLETEIARVGLSAGQLRQLEIEQAKTGAGTDAQRVRLEELNASREEAISTLARQEAAEKALKAAAEFQSGTIAPLQHELDLLGLVGPAREKAALALEHEAFVADLTARGVEDVNAAWERYLDLRTRIIEGESALDRDRQEAQLLAQELERLVGAISSVGGIGGALGGLLGIATGNLAGVGGPVGALLNTAIGTREGPDGKLVARHLGDVLTDVFGQDGPFGKTLSESLKGAGLGLMAGNAIFGQQNTIEQLGAGLGGVMGKVGGEAIGKALGSSLGALGSAAGPIGSIVGSIMGSMLGSALSTTPRGSATIGGSGSVLGVSSTAGDSAARIAAASKSAGAIIEGLDQLAAELGATIDASRGSVSIGVRDGNYRVDTTGQGITKTKKGAIDFGEDAEAAAYAAMMDLIRDGVLVGLRKGTENLLRNAKDLEAGIAKALSFEGVFSDLAAIKDPVGAALDGLDKEFGRLKGIFDEAGASTDDWLSLEELYWLKRDDLLKEAMDRELGTLRDFLSDLTTGNSALSLSDRRASALAAYTPLATRVSAGDSTAYDDFVEAARSLLDIERELSGSQSGYFTRLNEITGLTQGALDGGAGTSFAESDSPFGARGAVSDNASVVNSIDQLRDEIAAGTNAHLAAVNKNLGTVIGLLSLPSGQINYAMPIGVGGHW